MITRIIFGHSHGTCYVTVHQMPLLTQLIPLISVSDVQLTEIEVEVNHPSKSMPNRLPATIMVYRSHNDRNNIIKFRPSVGAEIFKKFADSVKAVAVENSENFKFFIKRGFA